MASSEVKEGTKDGEDASVTLNLKTSVLRVSIHCDACKRKVEKVLRKIQGVYKTEISLKQQMVTVTGDVDAETLIKKLRKKGKKAELLPQKPQKPVTAKNKERQSDPNSSKEPKKESVETEAPEKDQSANVVGEGSGKEASNEKASLDAEPATGRAGAEAKEVKQEGEENATASAGDRSAAEKQPVVGEAERGAEKSGGNGSAGKKKKKQGQNGNNTNGAGTCSGEGPMSTGSGSEEQQNPGQTPAPNAADRSRPRRQAGQHQVPPHSNDAPAGTRSPYEWEGQRPTLVSPNHAAPPHHEQWYSPPHHAPPPPHAVRHHAAPPAVADPGYRVSYHASYPSSSYGALHYPPDPPSHSYAYMHPGAEEERPPYYLSAHYQPDSFQMFSDENPNGCSIS